jgi:hypothetical protein
LERLLGFGRRLRVAGPGAERLEPEGVEQVVDGGQRPDQAELGRQDAADVRPAEGAHPIGRRRPGPQAVGHAGPGGLVERRLPAPPGGVGQPVRAAGVVPGDPGPDLPGREDDVRGDVLGAAAEEGEPDGGQPAAHRGPSLGPDAGGQFIRGVVGLDVHGDLLPVTTG